MKNRTLKLYTAAAILGIICLAGCATLQDTSNSIANWWKKPQTQQGVQALKEAVFAFAFTSGLAIVNSVASGEKIDSATATKAAMSGGAAVLYTSANYIRQLQGTTQVLDPVATAQKLQEAGLPKIQANQLSSIITDNAASLVGKGVSADHASEINASAFDAAALAIQSGLR